MKVIEAQSATLTNFEVYTHLSALKHQYATTPKLHPTTGNPTGQTYKRRGPGNYETVVKEVMEYLTASPSPLDNKPVYGPDGTLHNKPIYGPTTIKTLLTRLKPYELTKAEVLMILNLRPLDDCTLNMVVEDLSSRFSPEDWQELIDIIAEVLGSPETDEDGVANDEGDPMQM